MDEILGRVAFVTGAASGIGLAISDAFVEAGARVVLADRDEVSLKREVARHGSAACGVCLDVADRAAWTLAQRVAEEAFGPVDILVNNAGLAPDWNELVDTPEEHFDKLIAVMLTGVFNGIRTFAGSMRDRRTGHIVNMASLVGLIAGARQGAYVAAKYGVVGLSETLRIELEPHGVGVSVVCPARVRSNLLVGAVPPNRAADDGMDPGIVARHVLEAIRNNNLYVITHPEHKSLIAARSERLLEAFGMNS